MSLITKLLGKEEKSEETQEVNSEKPCNATGHNYKQKYTSDYYATKISNSLFSRRFDEEAFEVYKKTGMVCTKCGRYKQEKEDVGVFEVDRETDEITVVE